MPKLLVVDDDHELVDLLAYALGRAGFQVVAANDSPNAIRILEEERPDAAILDVNMGPWNGLDLLKAIRQRSDIAVIMLTGLDGEGDKVRGLDLGADDYVTKPFSHRELIARIRAQLRRRSKAASAYGEAPPPPQIEIGPLSLDATKHSANKNGQPLPLTATEFRALHYLMAHAGTVVPTRTLMKHVWGFDDPSGKDTVRVTIYRLRRKIEDNPSAPRLLHTVSGVGLILNPE
jgi:two-component system, OmpR family, response regulator VicR